jgi:uncharacterized protein YjdB
MFSRIVVIAMMIFGLSAGLTGCGGGGGGGTGSATLQSIAVTPSNQSLGIGASQAYTATGTYSDATTQNISASVTWASSSSSVASISASGVASTLTLGSTTISAMLNGKTGSAPLTVTTVTLQSISVAPANQSLGLGASQAYTATGTYSDATTQNISASVTWASSASSVASISASGVASALTLGSTTISATLNGKTGSAPLTVTTVTLQSISVTPANQSLGLSASQAYTATGTYSDATTQNISTSVTWTSSTPSIASISASGVASALLAGSTNISATASGKSGTTPLTVTAITLKSIAVTPAFVSINTAATQQLIATGTYSDGTTAPITSSITWATTDATIATVSTAGLVTGVAPQNGLAITATSGGFSGMSRVSVTLPANALVSISLAPQSMWIGQTFPLPFVAANFGSRGSNYTLVSWSSNNPAVATVDNSTGLVAALAAGTTTLTATTGTLSTFNTLTVTAPPLISITVLPANSTIASGATVQMTATGVYTDTNLNKDITSSVTWSSSNPAAVTVNATTGVATGVAAGSAMISAVSGGVTGTTVATVPATAPPPTTPTTVTLLPIADNTIIFSSTNPATETNAFPTGTLAVGCSWNVWFDSLAGMWIQDSVCAQSLVKFNLLAIPAGKTIVSATLRLQTNIYGVGYVPRSWFVRALGSSWLGNVTWNSALSFQYYLASASNYFPPTYVSQIYNIDQTNTVRNWVSGAYVNNGLEFGISNVLFPYATSLDAFDFFSSEDSGGRGPKLIVTYQ